MTTSDAAEHLRIIRQLMERSTVYRAISAPTALLGGVCALALSWWQSSHPTSSASFHRSWLVLFGFLSAVNMLLLWRDARRRGAPFFSSGMKLATSALAPPLLAGFFFGLNFIRDHSPSMCALIWSVFYGLALLATASFAPPSIARLGKAFVLAGLLLLALSRAGAVDWLDNSAITALTFGALHIIYAAAVMISSRLERA